MDALSYLLARAQAKQDSGQEIAALALGTASKHAATDFDPAGAAAAAAAPLAPLASPAFTGTVSGITAAMVGLGNVSNTSDAAKPISTAQAAVNAAKADLVGGVIPTSQIPALALVTSVSVASQAAMLALTSSQVQPGDLAIRTDGAGTFILAAADPSQLANWNRLNAPTDVVQSVNGQQGTIVLHATDVGADPAGAAAAAVAGLAPLASPAFTGTPTVPTAAAGTSTTQAASTAFVAAAVAAGGLPQFTSLSALNSASGTAHDGQLAALAEFTTANGTVLASTWRLTNGLWYALGPIKATKAAVLGDLKSVPSTYSGITFDPRFTTALVIRDGQTAANGWDEYVWIGNTTGFLLWRGVLTGGNWTNSCQDKGGSGQFAADGEWIDVNFHGSTTSTQIGQFQSVIALPPSVNAATELQTMSGGIGAWDGCTWYVDYNAKAISLLSTKPVPTQNDFVVSGRFRRLIPTA